MQAKQKRMGRARNASRSDAGGSRTEVTEITEEVLSSPPVRTRSSEKDRARENAGTAS
jgi:hypothetical protein